MGTSTHTPGAVYGFVSRYRQIVQAAADGVIWALCITGATLLRFGFQTRDALSGRLVFIVAVAVVVQFAIGYATELYRSQWRVGSFEQIQALAKTVIAVTVLVTLVNLTRTQHVVPASATIGGGAPSPIFAASSLYSRENLLRALGIKMPHFLDRNLSGSAVRKVQGLSPTATRNTELG